MPRTKKIHRWEIVHHKDNNPKNNKKENLQIMRQAEHINLHREAA